MLTLVTRPEPQASQWAADLNALGLHAQPLPLLALTAPPDAAPVARAWQQLAEVACVLFVSPAAAHWWAQARPAGACWPAGTLAAAPGPGTALALLQSLGHAGLTPEQVISPPATAAQFDSEHLWPWLAPHPWAGRRVLIASGGDQGEARGRQWLSAQWQAQGATVDALLAYTRGPAPWTDADLAQARQAWAQPGHHAWLFSSSQAIDVLQARMGRAPARAVAVCTHPRVAERAAQAGFGRLVDTRPQLAEVASALQVLSCEPHA
ncbi:uroporphyrinogen-III synthase [Aquabacterium lacunae]|uniref:Uroporphyrinogen-III synthase n=1 Tax=Aquabacterium lacunae TaxID=2528630 RepID=A0A4V2JG18_9BURK|nr:uroporphyrinogen-III synthase [Aquabacterium lacunae]TBO34386.1 uroporphyrinogen-III synthase [Aquabacterium lacunae]